MVASFKFVGKHAFCKPQLECHQLQCSNHCLRKSCHWQQALSLLETMCVRKIGPNVISYSASISACGRPGLWQQALSLLDQMPRSRIQPEVYSYNAAINACEKGGQWEQALNLFEAMARSKIQRTVISYSSTISACEKRGKWHLALNLFEGMFSAHVSPDLHSYSATISACEKGNQWQQALNLFHCMPCSQVWQDVYSYNATISACEKGHQWQLALSLFDRMPSAHLRQDVYSCNATISACQKCSQWLQALSLFNWMPEIHLTPDLATYNAILDCHGIHDTMVRQLFQQGLLPLLTTFRAECLDLHGLSEGAARLTLQWWLVTAVIPELNIRQYLECIVITGQGRSRHFWHTSDIQQAALEVLQKLQLQATVPPENRGRIRVVLRKKDLAKLQSCADIFGLGRKPSWKMSQTYVNQAGFDKMMAGRTMDTTSMLQEWGRMHVPNCSRPINSIGDCMDHPGNCIVAPLHVGREW